MNILIFIVFLWVCFTALSTIIFYLLAKDMVKQTKQLAELITIAFWLFITIALALVACAWK